MKRDGREHVIVGIDPGGEERTGLAVYAPRSMQLVRCESTTFWDVLSAFLNELLPAGDGGDVALVVVEDARSLPIYARHDHVRGRRRDRLCRNVGRVDQETALWADWLQAAGYRVLLAEPSRQGKWTAQDLARIAGWTSSTNQHARDAARLVWGRGASADGVIRGALHHQSEQEPCRTSR